MSWLQKNYEKASLGGAVAVALGLAYLGWSQVASVTENFGTPLKGSGSNNAAVKDAYLIAKARASLVLDRDWQQALDGERPVDLFTGIPLFISSKAPEAPIDLLKDAPVHPPIANVWWIENRLDPGFEHSPLRDPDQDGFSNLEEFNSKTNPNDPASIPSLIAKLMYARDESLGWVIRPSFGSEGKFPFKFQDTRNAVNATGAANMIAPGEMFFAKEPMMNRFKFVSSEVRKVVQKSTGIPTDVTIVKIEDTRPNKKGVTYEFPAPMGEDRMREYLNYDRTAIFSLEALGQNGKEFKVEENTKFALPPDSPKKDYLAKIVTPESVTVEYTNAAGETKTFQIKKGAMAVPAE
ncbi:MAG: Amuc_1099 family pilus-like system protein [Undibacterium sp.]